MEKQSKQKQFASTLFGDLSLHSVKCNVLYATLAGMQAIARTNGGLRI
jgi:hypothetical protein